MFTTPIGTYYYHKLGGGFASMIDLNGNDWIGYHPGNGSAGEYRGIPNLGGFGHPGYTNGTSSIVSQGPLKATISSQTTDGTWKLMWEVYPQYATMTLNQAGANYWLVYEGTPGGQINPTTDYWVRSSGQSLLDNSTWDGDIPSPEWAYFGDGAMNRVLYLAHHEDDSLPDSFWQLDSNMTVFGFGRKSDVYTGYLSAVPAHLTIGFGEQAGNASTVINAAFRDLAVNIQSPENIADYMIGPPTIATQPANQSVIEGNAATFSIKVRGSKPMTYQWMVGGANIAGATGASFTTAATVSGDNGAIITCAVSNSLGSVVSNSATLTVTPLAVPVITAQPANLSVTEGWTARFNVVATGNGTITYQWKKTGVNIAGATGASYTTPATTLADNGAVFTCVVSNGAGSVASNAATLTVTAKPPSLVVNGGFESGLTPWAYFNSGTGSFDTTTAGNGSAHAGHAVITTAGSNIQLYQVLSGLEANTKYRLTFAAYSNTGHDLVVSLSKHVSPYTNYGLSSSYFNLTSSWSTYSVEFTTSGFTGTVSDARLMFWLVSYAAAGDQYYFDDVSLDKVIANVLPAITTQPANQSVTQGQSATFSVVATGFAPLSYQWRRNGTDITGATSASYTTPATTVAADNGATFTCLVTNAYGEALSSAATLTVTTAPVPGGQITLIDITNTHTVELVAIPQGVTGRAFSWWNLPSGLPTNLVSPINYSQGTVYQRLEVLSKPSSVPVQYQLCIFQDEMIPEKHVCGPQPTFYTTGVYDNVTTLSSWYQYGNIDWTRSLLIEMTNIRDGAGNPVDDRWTFGGKWYGSPDFSLYYPMQVRFRAVLVPPGGVFAGW